jgi:2-polyprenyl-6-hydroxyphenyl methylase/3-demethylubiquinone-9 3-methyltransferase
MTRYSSISENEIEKFTSISNQWWDVGGKFKILHQINPLRLEYITHKIIDHFGIKNDFASFSQLSLLDVGCGGGLVTAPLHKLGFKIKGIDAGYENITAANEYALEHKLYIEYFNNTLEDFISEYNQESSYDVVLCLELLEHINSPEEFLQNVAKVLKPGGLFILSTINRNIKSYLLTIIMAENILRWVPKDTHIYSKFLKPSEINKYLIKNSLQLIELKGMSFDISNQLWRLVDDISVNYFVCAVKI